jgi:porphobilinogen deaminase
MLPAPAQGSLALEIREDRQDVARIVGSLDHPATRLCVEFERGFLGAVGGGCGAPVAAFARPQEGGVFLECFFAQEGATEGRRVSGFCAAACRREAFVRDLAAQVRKA